MRVKCGVDEDPTDPNDGGKYSLPLTDEEKDIISRAKEDGTYMKAPNGKQTNLDEKQWVQVRTKAFKNRFGDWENDPKNASHIVDENGEPRVVYHGTNLSEVNEGEPFYKGSYICVAQHY